MHMQRFLPLVCVILALLFPTGCQEDGTLQDSFYKTSQVWESMPELTYGQFYGQKLAVLPWYSGRTEATSKNGMAETELGFYASLDKLCYMDRANPVAWLPVCMDPSCSHAETEYTCGAYKGFGTGGFLLREGRIYIVAHMHFFPELSMQSGRIIEGPGLFSKSYNGSDLRIEYSGATDSVDSSFGYTSMLTAQGWLYNIKQMLPDGSGVATSCFVSDSGAHKLAEDFFESYNDTPMDEAWPASFKGDPVFYHTGLGPKLYGIRDGEIYEVDAVQYEPTGGYLSGNIIRQFRPGDGYYDINIETGEEIFLAAPQLENSKATIMLPNCIVETTLGSTTHPEGAPHSMMIFDGESWKTVTLPEELRSAKNIRLFNLRAVASDRLVFQYWGEYGECCYQILLDAENPTVEFFGQIH